MSNFSEDAEKDPDELEREIEAERAHINETLRALEQRFSPGQILDQVLRYTRSNGGDFSRNLVDTVKTNPVPTLLTATGLMWMIYGERHPHSGDGFWRDSDNPSRASYGVDPAYQSASGGDAYDQENARGSSLASRIKQGVGRLSGSARQTSDRTSQRAQHAKEGARQQAQRASQGFEHMLRDQPLALGAIGVALGALIGASVPRSQREDELLGKARQRVTEQAAQKADQLKEKAGDVGQTMAEHTPQGSSSSTQPPGAPH